METEEKKIFAQKNKKDLELLDVIHLKNLITPYFFVFWTFVLL